MSSDCQLLGHHYLGAAPLRLLSTGSAGSSNPLAWLLLPLCAFLLSLQSTALALYGHITRDTTWADTVLVTGDVVVDSGVVLTIEGGTQVVYAANDWNYPERGSTLDPEIFVVKGEIHAFGTLDERIRFIPFGRGAYALRLVGAAGDLQGLLVERFGGGGVKADSCPTLRISRSSFSRLGDANWWPVRAARLATDESWQFGIRASACDSVSVADCDFRMLKGRDGFAWVYPPGNGCFLLFDSCHSVVMEDILIDSVFGGRGDESDGAPAFGIGCTGCGQIRLARVVISNIAGGAGSSSFGFSYGGGAGYGLVVDSGSTRISRISVRNIRGGRDESGDMSIAAANAIGISVSCDTALMDASDIDSCLGGEGRYANSPGGSGFGVVWQEGIGTMLSSRVTNCLGGEGGSPDQPRGIGVGILCRTGGAVFGGAEYAQNDICGHSDYAFYNQSPYDIVATHNWWGTAIRDSIDRLVFDKDDSLPAGRVQYEPWADSASTCVEEEKPSAPGRGLAVSASPTVGSQVTIRLGGALDPEVTVQVVDILGRVVATPYHGPARDGLGLLWDAHDSAGARLPVGVYYICVRSAGSVATRKIAILW